MKTLKTKRIFVLIWVMLSVSVLASIWTLIENLTYFSKSHSLFWWVTLVRIINTSILIIISYKLWKIVKVYTEKNKWQPNFYQNLRHIGFWAILLTLLSSVMETIFKTSSIHFDTNKHIDSNKLDNYMAFYFFKMVLSQSAAMWVLTLCIFLFAELLRVANEVKAENESII